MKNLMCHALDRLESALLRAAYHAHRLAGRIRFGYWTYDHGEGKSDGGKY